MSAREPSLDREPTSDELLAMAYADNELDPSARAEFEGRLAREPALGREVAAQKRLHVLAREVAPHEPEDHEWARIVRSRPRRWILTVAWIFILVDVGFLVALGLWEFLGSSAPLAFKIAVVIGLGAFVAWFALVVRARVRTLPYDPYTGIKR
jgi:anti-sigma factor RsiW